MRARFFSSEGRVSLIVGTIGDSGGVGYRVPVIVKVGGIPVGIVRFEHLVNLTVKSGSRIEPGALLGYLASGRYAANACSGGYSYGFRYAEDRWEVCSEWGIHSHVEFKQACWRARVGTRVNVGSEVGIAMLSSASPADNRGACDNAVLDRVNDVTPPSTPELRAAHDKALVRELRVRAHELERRIWRVAGVSRPVATGTEIVSIVRRYFGDCGGVGAEIERLAKRNDLSLEIAAVIVGAFVIDLTRQVSPLLIHHFQAVEEWRPYSPVFRGWIEWVSLYRKRMQLAIAEAFAEPHYCDAARLVLRRARSGKQRLTAAEERALDRGFGIKRQAFERGFGKLKRMQDDLRLDRFEQYLIEMGIPRGEIERMAYKT